MDMIEFGEIIDRKIHDNLRAFCVGEGIDEDHFRYCISNRIREANRMSGKLPQVIELLSRIAERSYCGFISLRKALSGSLFMHGHRHRQARRLAKIPAGLKH